jgi:hypothetical protein
MKLLEYPEPTHYLRNLVNNGIYEIYHGQIGRTCIIGYFHMIGSNIIVDGLFLLADVEFLTKEFVKEYNELQTCQFNH